MIIINTTYFSKGKKELNDAKLYLDGAIKNLACSNECKRDFILNLQFISHKNKIQVFYSECCKDFEKKILPYLRRFEK